MEEFAFPSVLGEDSDNLDLYDAISGSQMINGVISGYRETFMAYGQTGSGKTHSIFGSNDEPGLLQIFLDRLYTELENDHPHAVVRMSSIELAGERLIDLLPDLSEEEQETSYGIIEVFLKTQRYHFQRVEVRDRYHAAALLETARAGRKVGRSALNAQSSRSHAITQFFVETAGGRSRRNVGTLTLVDLAGSERDLDAADRADARVLNTSLSQLNKLIRNLQTNTASEADRRQGALNRVLFDYVSPACGVKILFCVSPACALGSTSTLAMAANCLNIQCRRKQFAVSTPLPPPATVSARPSVAFSSAPSGASRFPPFHPYLAPDAALSQAPWLASTHQFLMREQQEQEQEHHALVAPPAHVSSAQPPSSCASVSSRASGVSGRVFARASAVASTAVSDVPAEAPADPVAPQSATATSNCCFFDAKEPDSPSSVRTAAPGPPVAAASVAPATAVAAGDSRFALRTVRVVRRDARPPRPLCAQLKAEKHRVRLLERQLAAARMEIDTLQAELGAVTRAHEALKARTPAVDLSSPAPPSPPRPARTLALSTGDRSLRSPPRSPGSMPSRAPSRSQCARAAVVAAAAAAATAAVVRMASLHSDHLGGADLFDALHTPPASPTASVMHDSVAAAARLVLRARPETPRALGAVARSEQRHKVGAALVRRMSTRDTDSSQALDFSPPTDAMPPVPPVCLSLVDSGAASPSQASLRGIPDAIPDAAPWNPSVEEAADFYVAIDVAQPFTRTASGTLPPLRPAVSSSQPSGSQPHARAGPCLSAVTNESGLVVAESPGRLFAIPSLDVRHVVRPASVQSGLCADALGASSAGDAESATPVTTRRAASFASDWSADSDSTA